MNSIIQRQLERVDTALNTLVESIASYNPSVTAANDLLAADNELASGVNCRKISKSLLMPAFCDRLTAGSVAAHQANHARILALRSEVSSLNATITSSITTLADTLTDFRSQKITPVTETQRPLPYQVLLEYAAKVSRYTAPRGNKAISQGGTGTGEAAAPINGADVGSQDDTQTAQEPSKEGEQQDAEAAAKALWVPWPTDGIIKQGALGHIQTLLETGQDPAKSVSQEVGEPKAEETVKDEEVGDAGVTAPVEPARPQEAMRREIQTEQAPKVFGGLDLYDPDNMDDE